MYGPCFRARHLLGFLMEWDQRTLFLVNVFIINTVDLLNRVSATCEKKIASVHQRIIRIEAALSLLEAKLESVDVVAKVEEPVVKTEPKEETPAQVSPSPEDPRLSKFVKMRQVGVPDQAVKLQMSLEGLDPSTSLPS